MRRSTRPAPRSRTTTSPSALSSCGVSDGAVLARRHNERELTGDPTAHAEMLAITDAAQALDGWRLDDCALVVTLEPCPMCAGAALAARIPLVVFGAADPKAGAVGSLYNLGADPRLQPRDRVARRRAGPARVGDLAQAPILRGRHAALDAVTERPLGGMRERPNRMVSKTIVAQVTVGSNPTPSATCAVRVRALAS